MSVNGIFDGLWKHWNSLKTWCGLNDSVSPQKALEEHEAGWLPVMRFEQTIEYPAVENVKINWIYSPSGRYAVNLGFGTSWTTFLVLDVLKMATDDCCAMYKHKDMLCKETDLIAVYWLSNDVLVCVDYDGNSRELGQHVYRMNHEDKLAEKYFSRIYAVGGDFKPRQYFEFKAAPLEVGTGEFLLLWDNSRMMFCLFPFNPCVGNPAKSPFFILNSDVDEQLRSMYGSGWKINLSNAFCFGKHVIVTIDNAAHRDRNGDVMPMTALNVFLRFSIEPQLVGDHDETMANGAVLIREMELSSSINVDNAIDDITLLTVTSANFCNSGSKLVAWTQPTPQGGMQTMAVIDFAAKQSPSAVHFFSLSFASSAFRMLVSDGQSHFKNSSATLDPFGHLQVWDFVGLELFCRELIKTELTTTPPSLYQLARDNVLYNMRKYSQQRLNSYRNFLFPQ